MIINVNIDDQDETIQYEIKKNIIVVGRSNDCDIKIDSDHISRKHLEISLDGETIYLKDLTLSNWVSYNNEKLTKKDYIQYFDFAPLVLPGGVSIHIEPPPVVTDHIEISSPATNSKVTRPRAFASGSVAKKLRDKKQEKQQISMAQNKETIIMVVVFLAVAIGFVLTNFDLGLF